MVIANVKQGENVPFVMTILSDMHDHMSMLDEKYSLVFYEALGNIIKAEKNINVA